MLAKHALSQLSYGPRKDGDRNGSSDRTRLPLEGTLVGLGGLEPPTSRLSSARSNQLSYKPDPEDRSEIRNRRFASSAKRPESVCPNRKRDEDGGSRQCGL